MAKKFIDADVLKRRIDDLEYENSNRLMTIAGNEVLRYYFPKIIDDAPAADVQEVRHGKWIKDRRRQYKCSKCGNFLDMDGVSCGRGSAFFCPNCGARMGGEENG